MFCSNRSIKVFALVFMFMVAFALASPSSTARAQMGGGGHMGGGTGGGMGSGMGSGMGNQDPTNMMNPGMMGAMMLVSGGTPYRTDGKMISMDDAVTIATKYLASINATGLALDEVEEWEFNFYVVVKEVAPSPYKAFQFLIDKWTGAAMPEPGANMMWGQKYSRMMNSMMDGMTGRMTRRDRKVTVPSISVTPETAAAAANQFLRERFSRALVVEGAPDVYYGFYTFDVKDVATGAKYGMLSVNGLTGQVWYHTWHGSFVQVRAID